MTTSIRPATIEDAPAIAKIHVQTWQCAYRDHLPAEYLDEMSIEKKTKGWQQGLSDPNHEQTAFVIEKEGEVVGWATIGPNRDPDYGSETGELCGLYVDSSHQRLGLGRQLLEHCLKELKNDGYIQATLWVLTTNEPSKKFYEKNGWQKEGKIKDEYKDGINLAQTRYILSL